MIGSIPTGVLVSLWAGAEDPRQAGSGNIGFTNVLRLSGKKVGLFTLLGDVGKGWIVGWFAPQVISQQGWVLLIALCVVVGHIYPIFLHFKGGKGVATAFGALAGLDLYLAGILVLIWLATAAISKYSSGAAIVAFLSLPVVALLMVEKMEFTVFSVLLSLLVLARHRDNLVRLARGSEPKMTSTSS